MRIAYVCADPGIPVFGQKGCSIHVQEVIRALRRQGADVELFAIRWGAPAPLDLAAVKGHALPTLPKVKPSLRESLALGINRDLRQALMEAGPFDLIYERYSLWSYSAMVLAQTANIPGLLEVNAPLIEEQARYRGLVHQAAAAQVAKKAFQTASQLIAVSEGVKQYLSRWVEDDKIQVISNGVNSHRFTAPLSTAPSKDSHTFTVGFVGSLKPWHGLTHLVNAFAQLHARVPQARLLIVGDGPQRAELEAALTRQNLLTVTHFTGAVAPEQIPALLATMDAAVAPYPAHTDFYFSPLKVMEYMAAGLPIVASRLGQLTTLIEDDVTGLLCSPGDETALAAALERLWYLPHLRQRLGWAAHRYILAHHTWDQVAQQILSMAQQQSLGLAAVG